jgi:hypothetical protein
VLVVLVKFRPIQGLLTV